MRSSSSPVVRSGEIDKEVIDDVRFSGLSCGDVDDNEDEWPDCDPAANEENEVDRRKEGKE